jgi:hypothetical protein
MQDLHVGDVRPASATMAPSPRPQADGGNRVWPPDRLI